MPKVSEAHREARREQIIAAALRCFADKGFQRTSMADIIAASGLSAGAIYLQFPGKQQIALEAGHRVLFRRLGALRGDGASRDPVETLHLLLAGMVEDLPDAQLLVQLWGEATAEPGMSELVQGIFASLKDAWIDYLTAWAASRGAPDAPAWARTATPTMLALAQGFLLQRALLPDFDADAYFVSVRAVAGPQLLDPSARAAR